MSKHLTIEDRREIETLLKRGYAIRRIAIRLSKSPSAISQEIKRNRRSMNSRSGAPGEYVASVASHKADNRRREASRRHKAILGNKDLRKFIDNALLNFQAPQAIAGRLKTGIDGLPYVSRNSIERYLKSVYGEAVRVEIAAFRKKYRRRINHNKKPVIDDRIFIDERPEIIQKRERVGDIELGF